MPPQYFQGRSVTGLVSASEAKTFSDVVELFRICPTLGLTRASFLALDEKERNKKKEVPFFVAACFKGSPSQRVYHEATFCNLIFLDIDELKEKNPVTGKMEYSGVCPAAPFVNNPETLYAALGELNFAAHTTASSTPEKPRMRVVVDADSIPVADYIHAVSYVANLMGITLNKESKVAVQPMFLPTQFQDSTAIDHPLIAHRTNGLTLLSSVIGDATQDTPATGYSRSTKNGDLPSIDSLDFLRYPIAEINLTVAREALEFIDPDCNYHEWLKVAAALAHQFGNLCEEELFDEAYELFDEWSAKGTKYVDSKETRKKWDSLRPSPIGRLPVTIRSLLHDAKAGGWDDKRVKESCFATLTRWMEDGAKNITELLEKGVQKIVGSPLPLSAMQEEMLVDQLRLLAKTRFESKVSVTAIRKDIAKLKADIRAQGKSAERIKEPIWAKNVLYVASPGEFFRHHTGEKYKPDRFDLSYARHLLPTEDSLRETGQPVNATTLSKPLVSPTDYALNNLKIVTAYDYAYAPSRPSDIFFYDDMRRKLVNTYSPTYPELDPKNADAAGKLLLAHLGNLIAEEEHRRTMIDYMAHNVQLPGRKIRWGVLLQGTEGCGKTFIAEAMKVVLGGEHVMTIDGSAIGKGWNEWAFGHQLVVLEEVRIAGTNRHEVMNALKPLITNAEVTINERNRGTRTVPNISNYLLFSNHHDALALDPGDRRYFVIKSPLQTKPQVLALGESYFLELFGMLQNRAGALRSFLMDWDISTSFNPDGHAPRTKYVADLIADTAGDLTAAIRRLLLEGDYPLVQFDIVSSKSILDIFQVEGIRGSAQQIAQVLRQEGFTQIDRHLIGGEKHYLWCRAGVDLRTAAEVAAYRLKNELKNLCMELKYE